MNECDGEHDCDSIDKGAPFTLLRHLHRFYARGDLHWARREIQSHRTTSNFISRRISAALTVTNASWPSSIR
ncbi:hypothetical protein IVB18_40230 [Bradyrhizobium sp. 186]|uniref:hypothetical protein n=1 Tax=Bradyrhizobium sp. 186 TaxID=2782654 RepID=UPI0020010D87|nr:hypothetical protein [Bradyrhizobium sp. 186]UPK34295.1 hypothetical protein IVB18_40230 [Bradyrhizobium sp. 186]